MDRNFLAPIVCLILASTISFSAYAKQPSSNVKWRISMESHPAPIHILKSGKIKEVGVYEKWKENSHVFFARKRTAREFLRSVLHPSTDQPSKALRLAIEKLLIALTLAGVSRF
jgi:hypothetical protein